LTTQFTKLGHGLKRAVIAWVVFVLIGYGSMVFYSMAPAKSAISAGAFPVQSSLAKGSGLTLITFLHPRCPCSRATVSELEELLSQSKFSTNLTIYAVVSQPRGCSADFTQGAILDSLSSMPNVQLTIDKDDVESQRFGARTSGQTLLFDSQGNCLFSGGVTAARGEVGANAGVDALRQCIASGQTAVNKTPVFGCSLESNQ
jgi:hypothetical protein